MNEAIQKFKDVLGRVHSVAVSPGAVDDINKLIAAAILHKAFVKLGKQSIFCTDIRDEKIKRFIEALCGNINSSDRQEHLVIKLDSKTMPVSELKYEKEGDIFKIILQSNGSLDTKNVVIEKTLPPVDLLMLVDPKETDLNMLCTSTPHRDVIKLTSKDHGIAVKVVDIVQALFNAVPADLVNPLWYLIDHSHAASPAEHSRELEIKQMLIGLGADTTYVHQANSDLLGNSFWKLLGRAMSRSEFEKRTETVWSFLPHNDFQKTGQGVSAVVPLFETLRSLRPEGKFFALMWENVLPNTGIASPARSIHAIVGGNDPARLAALATLMQSQLSSTYFLLQGFETFSQAELSIRSHIQRIL